MFNHHDPIWWHYKQPKQKAKPQPGPYPGLPDLPLDNARCSFTSPLYKHVGFLNYCYKLPAKPDHDIN